MTSRQREVLLAYRQGGSYRAAAKMLGISEHTIKAHLADLRRAQHVTRTDDLFRLLV